MQIVFHTGAHLTDDDRLIKCLRQNRDNLQKQNVNVPGISAYRKWIRSAFQEETDDHFAEIQQDVQKAVIGNSTADRHIISNPGFFGTEKMSFGAGHFYRFAESRIDILGKLFPNAELEMCMAIRNPATFLPLIYYNYHDALGQDRLYDNDLYAIRWSDFFLRIRQSFPHLPLTVWCNEDTPIIWSRLIRSVTHTKATDSFAGEFDLLYEILNDAGIEQFETFLKNHPDLSETQRERVIATSIEKFAREDALEQEIELAGWSEDLIDDLTTIYDDDLERLSEIHNLNLILPEALK